MAAVFLRDLRRVCANVTKQACTRGSSAVKTILMFDLCESTSTKLDSGHTAGIRRLLQHNLLCTQIVKRCGGDIVKEIGDGLLSRLPSPLDACLGALNVKNACLDLGIKTKIAVTMGQVELIPVAGRQDILGVAVDRCARLQAIARPNQIVLDSAVKTAVESHLRNFPEIRLSIPATVNLKGIGKNELFELSTEHMGFAGETSYVGFIGEIPVSPVQSADFPEWTAPESWLVCETCGEPIEPSGEMAILVFTDRGEALREVHLVHKGDCDKYSGQWKDVSDLGNPEEYADFVKWLVQRLAEDKWRLKDPKPVIKALFGMYRRVFRPSTAMEQIHFRSLVEMGRHGI